MEPSWIWIAAAVAVVVVVAALAWRAARAARRAGHEVRGAAATMPAAPRGARGVRAGLRATRERLVQRLDEALGRGPNAGETLPALEEALVAADIGVPTARELTARLGARLPVAAAPDDIRGALRAELAGILQGAPAPEPRSRPWVVLVTGVNGVGKTTTIGKLAARHRALGRTVLLVAADTFRAAAIEQLRVWAERTGSDVVSQAQGASAAAVVFDGIKAAMARRVDVVLVDSAGRLHTRVNLMDELAKVRRVIEREVPGAPHETLLVLDATTGQNAVAQARGFAAAVGVTGIVLTKLDGTARGGVAAAVRRELGVPIQWIGVGEGIDDLQAFDAEQFVSALLDDRGAPDP